MITWLLLFVFSYQIGIKLNSKASSSKRFLQILFDSIKKNNWWNSFVCETEVDSLLQKYKTPMHEKKHLYIR